MSFRVVGRVKVAIHVVGVGGEIGSLDGEFGRRVDARGGLALERRHVVFEWSRSGMVYPTFTTISSLWNFWFFLVWFHE